MNISLSLDHINVVQMIGVIDINDKKYKAYEFCNGGDLRRYMQYFRKFDEELIQIIAIKMINGLMELQYKKVIHHDIKPENILVQLFPDEDITPEIEKKIEDIKEIAGKKPHITPNQENGNKTDE